MRFTEKKADRSWELKGMDWKELSNLPPLVYGAIHKLMEAEELIDELNDPVSEKNGRDLLAMRELLGMNGRINHEMREGSSWLMKRFCRLT